MTYLSPHLLLVLVLSACGGSKALPPDAAKPSPKAAAAEEAKKRAEARKREREAKDKAEEEAKAKLDALAVLPDKLPASIDKACGAMVKAYDAYMETTLEGDMLTKWKTGGNEMQLKIYRHECKKTGIEVAACQTHALSKATPDIEEADLMTACREKFAAAGKAPG